MSDGPHRSLPMRVKWKKVAELAGNANHDVEDVAAAICDAIEGDWRREVSMGVLNAVLDVAGQSSLIPEITVAKLERIKQSAAGRSLAVFFLDALIQDARSGRFSPESMEKAVSFAMLDRTRRCHRQMEELLLRKVSPAETKKLIERFSKGAVSIGFDALGRNMLKGNRTPLYKRAKRTGIDEGPEI